MTSAVFSAKHAQRLGQVERTWGLFHTVAKESAIQRVLIVDDELLIRWSLTQVLRDKGFDVVQADTAATALAAVGSADKPFDFVLLDFRLPDSADLTLLATLRRISPSTGVILMSAFATAEVQQSALALGARLVLNKPFELHDIPSLLKPQ